MVALFIFITALACIVALQIQRNKAEKRMDGNTGNTATNVDSFTQDVSENLHSQIFSDEYVILDVETTGLDARSDKIIQISAIRYDSKGKMLKCYNTYVNPGVSIPASASSINHITDDMVSSAPRAEEVADAFLTFIGNDLLVGYNVTFDLKFLNNTFSGVFQGRQYVDALSIARKCFDLPNYRLQTAANFAGFRSGSFHNSLVDCEAVAAVLHCANVDIGEWIKEFYIYEPRYSGYAAQPIRQTASYVESRGREYWNQGETARIAGDFEKALKLYDKARDEGFKEASVYWSYAKIYRKRKEYDLEIAILEEAANSCDASSSEAFSARRNHVKDLRTNAEKRAAENIQRAQKREERAARKLQEEEAKAQRAALRGSRHIRQLTDDGEVVEEFETIAAAERAVGVSSKSIRSAATGKQKHAGGFCWEYVTVASVSDSDTEKAAPDGAAQDLTI